MLVKVGSGKCALLYISAHDAMALVFFYFLVRYSLLSSELILYDCSVSIQPYAALKHTANIRPLKCCCCCVFLTVLVMQLHYVMSLVSLYYCFSHFVSVLQY